VTALLFATLVSLPIYPLNPVQQDTVSFINLHVTAGFNGPSSIITSGPELTFKYEMVIAHPFILRSAFDYRYGTVSSIHYPDGDLHRGTFSAEGIYYRGTEKLTGYFGLGLVWSTFSYHLSEGAADSLRTNFGISEVGITSVPGYRITAGLRIHRSYSIEIGLTDTRPDYVYTIRHDANSFSVGSKQIRFNDFRVSLGYLFSLKL